MDPRHRTRRPRAGVLAASAIAIAAAIAAGVPGCARVDPGPDYEAAAAHVAAATGHDALYDPEDEDAVGGRVRDLLTGGLTADEAVEIALLRSPRLQAALFDIGIARADAVQAGLLSNPSLVTSIRLPIEGGPTSIEAGLVKNLVELWQIPVRRRVALRRLRRTVLEIADEGAALAARTHAAYHAAVAARESLAVETENLAIIRELVELTSARQQAGDATQVDVNIVRADLLEQEIAVRGAQLALHEAKRRLAILLGLDAPPEGIVLAGSLADVPEWNVELETVVELATAGRLDLRAARVEVEAAQENVRLARRLFIRNSGAGAAYEGSGTGKAAVGPAIDVELPIFDQNQAGIARERFHLEQARKLLEALTLEIVQETRGAYARSRAAWDVLRTCTESLVPLQRSNLELAREAFRQGQTGFLSVLQAQRSYLASRHQMIVQRTNLALALAELQRAAAQPLAAILAGLAPAPRTENTSGRVER